MGSERPRVLIPPRCAVQPVLDPSQGPAIALQVAIPTLFTLNAGEPVLKLHVNGLDREIEVEADTPLLWVLREQLGLNGSKYSCGIGICGACLVSVDGRMMASCMTPVSAVAGKAIVTIEGVSGRLADAVWKAWAAEDVPQCGYCQAGQIVAAIQLLGTHARPSDSDIDAAMSRVLCRCGAYPAVRRAILQAASEIAQ